MNVAKQPPPPVKTPAAMFWLAIFVFIFTIVGCLMYLIIAEPNQDTKAFDYLMFTFRLMAALSAALVTAMLPGFLNLDWANKLGVRAGGAMAAFLIVWWTNPPELASNLAEQVAYNSAYSKCGGGDNVTRKYDPQDLPYCQILVDTWGSERWDAALVASRMAFQDTAYSDADTWLEKSFELMIGKSSKNIDHKYVDSAELDILPDLYQLVRAKTLTSYKMQDFQTTLDNAQLGRYIADLSFGKDEKSLVYRKSLNELTIAQLSALGGFKQLSDSQVSVFVKLVENDVETEFPLKPYLLAVSTLYTSPCEKEKAKEYLLNNISLLKSSVDKNRGAYIMQLKCLTIFSENECKYTGGSLPSTNSILRLVSADHALTDAISSLN